MVALAGFGWMWPPAALAPLTGYAIVAAFGLDAIRKLFVWMGEGVPVKLQRTQKASRPGRSKRNG
jgi:hypothetical protein